MSSSESTTPSDITKVVLLLCSFVDTLLEIGLPGSSLDEETSFGISSWIYYSLSHTCFEVV